VAMPAPRCGEPGRPGRADVAPPGPFRRSAAMYPVLASATARPISGCALDSAPRRRRRWPDSKEVSYYHRVTPCGLSNRARRTPVVAGLPPRRSPTLGSCIQATRDRWFPESGLCSHRCVHGACGSVLHGSAGVSRRLNKYTPAREC